MMKNFRIENCYNRLKLRKNLKKICNIFVLIYDFGESFDSIDPFFSDIRARFMPK